MYVYIISEGGGGGRPWIRSMVIHGMRILLKNKRWDIL